MSISVARARSRAAQLLAIGATAAVLAAVGVAMAGALESGLDNAVRAASDEPAARLIVAGAGAAEVEASVRDAFGATPMVVEDAADGATLTPDGTRVGTGDLVALRDGADRLADAVVDNGVASRTAVTGEMPAWAQDLLDLSWRARLLGLVPFLIVGVGGLVAARDVVRVLALSRISELAVLRSRGASRRRIFAGELREIALVGVAGASIGGVVAALAAGTPPLLAIGLAAVVPVALAVVAIPVVRAATPGNQADEAAASSGRARAAGVVGLVVLFAATALAMWRLLGTGSAADPVGIAAPALGVLAAAVIVLVVVAAAARVADLSTGRWVGLGPALAVRRISRRLPVLATVVLLVSIAAMTTVFAAAFGATGDRVARDVRELRVGGDLLVSGWPATADPDALAADGVAPLLSNPGQLGDDEPVILAAPAERLDVALRPLAGLVDPAELAALTAAPAGGLALPAGTTALEFTIVASDGVALQAWVLEPSGRVHPVPLDGGAVAGAASAVLAIDADVSRAAGAITARITSLVASTPQGSVDVPLPTDWAPQFVAYSDFEFGRFSTTPDTLGFELGRTSAADVHVRLMAPGEPFARIPAVITADFATRNGLSDGDDVDVRFAGAGRNVIASIAGTVAALPTAGDRDAILVDYPAFAEQQLRITESIPETTSLVVRSADPDAVREALPAGAVALGLEPATPDRMLGIARALLWVAAAGAVLLAAVGVASVSAALVAERRRETRILSVLGETDIRLARGQRLELAVTMALAGLGGIATGTLLAIVTVPSFAQAAAPGSGVLGAVTLAVDVPTGVAVLGVLVALLAAVLLVHGRRVLRDARTAGGGAP
jgi:hypothetical protein